MRNIVSYVTCYMLYFSLWYMDVKVVLDEKKSFPPLFVSLKSWKNYLCVSLISLIDAIFNGRLCQPNHLPSQYRQISSGTLFQVTGLLSSTVMDILDSESSAPPKTFRHPLKKTVRHQDISVPLKKSVKSAPHFLSNKRDYLF